MSDKNFSATRSGVKIIAPVISTEFSIVPPGEDGSMVRAHKDMMIYNPGPSVVHVIAGAGEAKAMITAAAGEAVSPIVPPESIQVYGKGSADKITVIAVGGPQPIVVITGSGD